MAAVALKYELTCPICLDVYTCPIMLGCGHNFCRDCIQKSMEQQVTEYRDESCPECRRTCSPEDLHRVNFNLGNIAEHYRSLQGFHSTKEVPCTYCIQCPAAAVRTCLHCEASFCKQHLDVHSKSQEHVLVDPTTSLQSRKCCIHNEIFKYFCLKEQSCICASCCLFGEHKDHPVELLAKASLSKKEQLKKVLENLNIEREAFKGRADVLRDMLAQNKEKVVRVKKGLEAMYSRYRERVVDAHVTVMNEVGWQLRQISERISGEISSAERRAAKLSQDLVHVQAACRRTDPLFVLQDTVCRAVSDRRFSAEPNVDNKPAPPAQNMDMLLISLISQKIIEGVSDLLPSFLYNNFPCLMYMVDVLLNEATASPFLTLSADLKTVTYSKKKLFQEPRPNQFKTSQVLSISSFSTGKYFWDIITSKNGVKAVGVAYPTIERSGLKAFLGYNEKSWCLIWGHDHIEVCHNSDCKQIVCGGSPMRAVGVLLDYKAGLLSFYRLCEQVKHLHTITATFTEPLHAAFYVVDGWIKINPPLLKNPAELIAESF